MLSSGCKLLGSFSAECLCGCTGREEMTWPGDVEGWEQWQLE